MDKLPPKHSLVRLIKPIWYSSLSTLARKYGLKHYQPEQPITSVISNWDKATFLVIATEPTTEFNGCYNDIGYVMIEYISDPTLQFIVGANRIALLVPPTLNVKCPYCRAAAYMAESYLYCSKQCDGSQREQKR